MLLLSVIIIAQTETLAFILAKKPLIHAKQS